MVLGSLAMIGGAGCSWKWTVSLFPCILAYNWIHKKTAGGILLMGSCRALLWITALLPPAHSLHLCCALWAVAVGVYVIGISWYARNEGKPPEKRRKMTLCSNEFPLLSYLLSPSFPWVIWCYR